MAGRVRVREIDDDEGRRIVRMLLREEGVTFQRLKTWKASTDPDNAVENARVEHLYAIADREVIPGPGEPEVSLWVGSAVAAQAVESDGYVSCASGGNRPKRETCDGQEAHTQKARSAVVAGERDCW